MDIQKLRHDLGIREPNEDKQRLWPSKNKLSKTAWPKLLAGIDPENRPGFGSSLDKWQDGDSPQLLCIHGEVGTGKTTLMVTLIEYLQAEALAESKPGKIESTFRRTKPRPTLLAFFFCQRNDCKQNKVEDILKSLIYQLICQCKALDSPIELAHIIPDSNAQRRVIQGPNAVYVLRDILREILQQESICKVYLLVDGLEECTLGLAPLLSTITDQSYKASWLVTTGEGDIVAKLDGNCDLLNINSRQNTNVTALVDTRIKTIPSYQNFDTKTRKIVRSSLVENSGSSYLWADLALRGLEVGLLKDVDFSSLGKDLQLLYEMLTMKIKSRIEATATSRRITKEILFPVIEQVLHWTTTSYNPLHLDELNAFIQPRACYDKTEGLENLITMWDPFLLTYQDTVYFRHQSIRDHIISHVIGQFSHQPSSGKLEPTDGPDGHWRSMLRCLEIMAPKDVPTTTSANTSENMNSQPHEADLRPGWKYACYHWVDHLVDARLAWKKQEKKKIPVSNADNYRKFLSNGQNLHKFLQANLLRWLFALFDSGTSMDGILNKLTILASELPTDVDNSQLRKLLHDAKRLILDNKEILEEEPSQLYTSILAFAPKTSIIKNEVCKDNGVRVFAKVKDNWSPIIHTLEGHSNWVKTVSFSPDGRLLVSGSDDKTVKLWDTVTGSDCATLRGHSGSIYATTFVDDGQSLVSASSDHTIKLWKIDIATETKDISRREYLTNSIAFSWDRQLVAYASDDRAIKICRASEEQPPIVLEGHSSYISDLTFSPDGMLLASASGDETVRIWKITDRITDREFIEQSRPDLLQSTLEYHSGPVSSVSFSPDGKLLASAGSRDQTIIIWGVEDKSVRAVLIGHIDSVNSAVFSPDGQLLASASDDGTVRLWNVQLGIPYGILEGHSSWVRSVSFSLDGQLASASDDGTVKIWDIEMGKAQRALNEHSNSVTTVVFSPQLPQPVESLNWYASASDDKTVKLWDRATGKIFATLEGHSDTINCVVFSPDGRLIASASDDNTIKFWDTKSLRKAREDTGSVVKEADFTLKGHEGRVTCIAFDTESTLVASSSSDKTVILWDVEKHENQNKGEIIIRHKETVRVVAISHDKATKEILIASASNDAIVQLWRSQEGTEISTAQVIPLNGHKDWVRTIAFSHDGSRLASGSDDGDVRIWTTAKLPDDNERCLEVLKGHEDWIRSLAFSSDDKILVSGSDDSTVRVWNAGKWQEKPIIFKGHTDHVNSIALSPESKLVVSASKDSTVRIWEIATLNSYILDEHSDSVRGAAFSPDGQQIVSVSDDRTVKLCNTESKDLVVPSDENPGPITKIEFSPTKNLVATLSGTQEIRLWDLKGSPHRTLRSHSGIVNCISFSEDGELLVSGSDDKSVKLWDTTTGKEKRITTSDGHSRAVKCIAFLSSNENKFVASGSDDMTVRLWDMRRRTLDRILVEHTDSINSVAFSSNGERVASASDDKKAVVWCLSESSKFRLIHPGRVNLVTFLGDKVATASCEISSEGAYTYKVRLWESGKEVPYAIFEGHTDLVTAINISPDEKLPVIVTASDDNKIRMWPNGPTKKPKEISSHGPIRKLHFSQDGSYLITDRGYVRHECLLSAQQNSGPALDTISRLYVRTKWVTRDMTKVTKFFRIPDEYRPSQVFVHDDIVVLGHDSGNISVLTFDLKGNWTKPEGYSFSRTGSSKSKSKSSESGS